METVTAFFKHYPKLAIFLTLGVGYWVGGIKLGNFSLGAVTGTLLVDVIVDQMGLSVSPTVKTVLFQFNWTTKPFSNWDFPKKGRGQ